MRSTWLALALVSLLSACASYGVIDNKPMASSTAAKSYGVKDWNYTSTSSKLFVTLAFSGGGTRAAALSYGVLKELRDTIVPIDGRSVRLLDEVDTITSVSAGSFTAAYYGLNGDKIFTDFERVFLRRDINRSLIHIVLNPLAWFSSAGRTERAIQSYDEHIFNHATFADMAKPNRPFIFINASDLG